MIFFWRKERARLLAIIAELQALNGTLALAVENLHEQMVEIRDQLLEAEDIGIGKALSAMARSGPSGDTIQVVEIAHKGGRREQFFRVKIKDWVVDVPRDQVHDGFSFGDIRRLAEAKIYAKQGGEK